MPTILSKLKDGTFKIGNLFIDKGVRWLECIDKKTGNIDSYILESTWYMETHPVEKSKFAKQVYAFCDGSGIENKNDMQTQEALNEILKKSKQDKIDKQELERITKEAERIKKEDQIIATYFVNSRLRGRSPLTITKPQ